MGVGGGVGGSQSQLSALELENRLLKNEVQSLNEEMNAVIKRAKDSQEGELAAAENLHLTLNSNPDCSFAHTCTCTCSYMYVVR